MDHPRDGAQRRRLARAVGADAGDHLAWTHGQVDVADHLEAAVARGEIRDFEQRRLVLAQRRDGPHLARELLRLLAEVCGDDLRVVADRGRLALGQQLAEVQHVHVIADAHDQAHVVVDEEHRNVEALSDRMQQVGEMHGLLGV